jgi:aminoglycoside phosphotransferase family enzyme
MSWVFFVGDEVLKLKKPVRFPYLDFSTPERRHAACRAELTLNRRLAPDVYKRLAPLALSGRTLEVDGAGRIVDWLVVMRRLDEDRTLERLLLTRRLAPRQLDPLIGVLRRFYRQAVRVAVSPAQHLERWHRGLADNRRVLLEPHLGLPAGLVRRVDRRQTQFLSRRRRLLAERVRRHCIVDGHGDLRPEHIWPGPPVLIIDCLEFNPVLRAVDPLDELAFLYVECARLGAAGHGAYIVRRLAPDLPGGFSPELFAFYCSYRAMLRARLAIAHLLEARPRTPLKWPVLARAYLSEAVRAADRLAPGGVGRHAR